LANYPYKSQKNVYVFPEKKWAEYNGGYGAFLVISECTVASFDELK